MVIDFIKALGGVFILGLVYGVFIFLVFIVGAFILGQIWRLYKEWWF